MTLLDIPLSYALYETKVSALMLHVFRLYFNQGYAFTYRIADATEDQQDLEPKGGIFETVAIDKQYIP